MKIQERGDKFVIVDFNELEAYKIATKIEKDGIRFYENLCEGIKDEDVKDKMKLLLQEERKHLNLFEDRLYDVRQRVEDSFEEDDLLSYMEYGIFQPYQSIENMGEKIDDVKKALRLGIIVEEKSIKFYQVCNDNVFSSETKKELQGIIEEEKRHKTLFENMINT